MKKIFVLSFCLMMSFPSYEIFGDVVFDPTNAVTFSNMLKTLKETKKQTESLKKSAVFINKVIKGSKEVKKLFAILDAMFCQMDEMEMYAELNGGMNFPCGKKLEIDMTLMKIDGISEKLAWIQGANVVATQYETIKSLSDLNETLEDAVREVNVINSGIRGNLIAKIRNSARRYGHGQSTYQSVNMNL